MRISPSFVALFFVSPCADIGTHWRSWPNHSGKHDTKGYQDTLLITHRYLGARSPTPTGQRVDVFDTRIPPALSVRICDTEDTDPARRGKAGKIRFVFSHASHPLRHRPGAQFRIFGTITLKQARGKAGERRARTSGGIDPANGRGRGREKEPEAP